MPPLSCSIRSSASWESGRVWDRGAVLDMLVMDDAAPTEARDFTATTLAADVVLLTYRSRQGARTAIRSSVWRRRDGGPWRIVFHQGTLQPQG
jgi:hypothetical protein